MLGSFDAIARPGAALSPGDLLFTEREAPPGYVRCDGSVLLQADYPKLFETLGLRPVPGAGAWVARSDGGGGGNISGIARHESGWVGIGQASPTQDSWDVHSSPDGLAWSHLGLGGGSASFRRSAGSGSRKNTIASDGVGIVSTPHYNAASSNRPRWVYIPLGAPTTFQQAFATSFGSSRGAVTYLTETGQFVGAEGNAGPGLVVARGTGPSGTWAANQIIAGDTTVSGIVAEGLTVLLFTGLGVYRSLNGGVAWSLASARADFRRPAAPGAGGRWVAPTTNAVGEVAYSDDNGTTWTTVTVNNGARLEDIGWDGGQFVAVSTSGQSLVSGDGVTWSIEGNVGVACWDCDMVIDPATGLRVLADYDSASIYTFLPPYDAATEFYVPVIEDPVLGRAWIKAR